MIERPLRRNLTDDLVIQQASLLDLLVLRFQRFWNNYETDIAVLLLNCLVDAIVD